MTFFYDLNKRLKQITESNATPSAQQLNEAAKKEPVKEKWDKPTKVASSEKGKYKGVSLSDLRSRLAKLKKSGPHKKGSKEYGTMRELQFAIRAKTGWGKVEEAAKPDFIDIDHDGNKKESMKKAAKDVKKAKVEETSLVKEKMSPKMREKFAALAEPRDKITYADKIAGARKHHRGETQEAIDINLFKSAQKAAKKIKPIRDTESDRNIKKPYGSRSDVIGGDDDEEMAVQTGPRKRGRPKGAGRRLGARGPSGRSKLLRQESAIEIVVPKHDHGHDQNHAEYDQEGGMAKEQLHTIVRNARQLERQLGEEDNLPEWVQSKLARIQGMMTDVNNYMASTAERDVELDTGDEITEKAVSQQQQKFMGMVHAMQKGKKIKGASKELKKVARTMKPKDVEDYAKTKHKGLPKKKEEKVEETTTSGSVATAPAAAPKSKKGVQFGKGIYDSLNRSLEDMISEGMNVSVNMGTNADGEETKSININADGEDAEKLAQLLNLAGIHKSEESCPACGETPCGCEQLEEVSENKPDWPTDEIEQDTDFMTKTIAGGLNKQKQTGQTTIPVLNRDPARQGSNGVHEGADLGMKLYQEYQGYKKSK
jgi:hypothetical protein